MTMQATPSVQRQQLMQQQQVAAIPAGVELQGSTPPVGAPFAAAPPLPAPVSNPPPASPSPPPSEDPRLVHERAQRAQAEQQARTEREARERLEADMQRRDEAERQRQLAQLPPEQQVASRLSSVEQQLAQERAHFAAFRAQQAAQTRSMELFAYRERALRDVPTEVHGMVGGASELEIDQSVDSALRTFNEMTTRIRQQVEQEAIARVAAGGYGAIPIPPPNPHYVPPTQPYGAQGFPSVVAPQPVVQGQPDLHVSDLTSEAAVRTGRYSGELRERVHQNLRASLQGQYPGGLGSAPRHWNQVPANQPMPHAAAPGGVMQPTGIPTAPVVPAHYQQAPQAPQHPQYAQPQQPQTGLPGLPQMPGHMRQAGPQMQPQMGQPPVVMQHQPAPQHNPAADAIARLHSGQLHPEVMTSNVASALNQSNQYAQANGISSPMQAFNQRFNPSNPTG